MTFLHLPSSFRSFYPTKCSTILHIIVIKHAKSTIQYNNGDGMVQFWRNWFECLVFGTIPAAVDFNFVLIQEVCQLKRMV